MERVRSFYEWRTSLNPPTFASAAEFLTKARGWRVSVAQVILWETAQVVPSTSTRMIIEHCTDGAVPIDSWSEVFDDGHAPRFRFGGYSKTKKVPDDDIQGLQ